MEVKVQKIGDILQKAIELLSGHLQAWIIFALMLMVLVEVVTRYVLNSPLGISHEMGAYLLVAITFMGLAYTWRERGHVRVEFVVSKLPAAWQLWIRLFTLLVAAAFSVPLIIACINLLSDSLLFQSRSGTWLRTPLVIPQTVLLIGSVLLFVQLIIEVVKHVVRMRQSAEE